MIFIQYYSSPTGELIIGDYDGKLVLCDWKYRKKRKSIDERLKKILQADYCEQETQLTQQCIHQLNQYFREERKSFNLPIHPVGTTFQKTVWEELLKIPYGKTVTYKCLSLTMNSPNAVRAIASANGANALSIIIPCHRVIGSKNELTGYAGGLAAKEYLLKLEKCEAFNRQLGLF